MNFKVANYHIRFFYYDYSTKPIQVGHDAFAYAATVCQIIDTRNLETPYYCEAYSYCSTTDAYNREHGERLALARAIDKFEAHKDDDPAIADMFWHSYNVRVNFLKQQNECVECSRVNESVGRE